MESFSLKTNITLPKLTGTEIGWLIHWCGAMQDKFPALGEWICKVCVVELERRQQPGTEAGMLELPTMVWFAS